MDPRRNYDQRVGRFVLPEEDVRQALPYVREILSRCVVLRCEQTPETCYDYEYFAICDEFDEREYHAFTSSYEWVVSPEGVHAKPLFRRSRNPAITIPMPGLDAWLEHNRGAA